MRRVVMIIGALIAVGALYYFFRPRPVLVEMGKAEKRLVQEYIAEEAKTRLAREYTLDMPIAGTLERIALEAGDEVTQGQQVAQVEMYELEGQIKGIEARIAQVSAQTTGVDVAKPKTEDLNSAAVRVKEATDAQQIAVRQRDIARINVEKAKTDLARVEQLYKEGIGSESDYDAARRTYQSLEQAEIQARIAEESARKNLQLAQLAEQRLSGSIDDNEYMRSAYKAEIDSLNAQLDVLKKNLEKARIVAPVAGPILEKYVADRRVLPPGTPLMKLGDLASMEIECDILSEDAPRVKPGQVVQIEGKALGGKQAEGKIKRVYPSAFMKISSLGIEQQRVKVLVAFDNTPLGLRAGTRVDVHIITNAHDNVVAVPERATFRRDDKWSIFKVEDGRAQLVPIQIGIKNEAWAEVVNGVNAGDTIVVEPGNELTPGANVAEKEI